MKETSQTWRQVGQIVLFTAHASARIQRGDSSEALVFTYWCRVLLEKLTGLQLVKKFPAFYGTRMSITALTSVRHLSLSWASTIQSTYPHPTSWRSILILSAHLRLVLTRINGITSQKTSFNWNFL